MEDALSIMLYCFSASAKGNFLSIADVSFEHPYITIDRHCLEVQHLKLFEAFEYFVAVAAEIPRPGQPLVLQLKDIV